MNHDLNHPCKDTCSGWFQGFERGKEQTEKAIQAMKSAAALLEEDYFENWEQASRILSEEINRIEGLLK